MSLVLSYRGNNFAFYHYERHKLHYYVKCIAVFFSVSYMHGKLDYIYIYIYVFFFITGGRVHVDSRISVVKLSASSITPSLMIVILLCVVQFFFVWS